MTTVSFVPDRSLEDRIAVYASLTPAERADVDANVTSRSDLSEPLAEAKALASILDGVGAGDDDLVRRIVDARLGHGPDVQISDSEQERAAEIRAALDSIEGDAEPPLAQFQRLTGHALTGPPDVPSIPVTARDAGGDGHMSRPVVAQLAPDRRASKPSRQRSRRWITVAGALLTVTYGGLFMASSVMVPERVQVADLSDIQASFRPVRGADQSDDYAEAAALLSEAHHSTLGLFPRYDDAGLNAAADAFGEIARESPDDQYGQEAALALGRIRLLQNQADASRIALESVVARGSYRAPEAVRLLDYLDTQAVSE